jgi:biotin operon repressor
MKIKKTQPTKFVRGGAEYSLNEAERIVLQVLKAHSPRFVSAQQLAKDTLVTEDHVRKVLSILRPLAVMESCAIENEGGRGYRLIKVEPYDFSISN